ncbi:MAG: hypothetical protein ACI81Y_001013 [Glaciecola sp.]|jgi:hypothetical protein
MTAQCVEDVMAAGTLTAVDACQGDITTTGVDTDNGGAGCDGDPLIITRTWTFDDGCGNVSSVSKTITVIDTIAPVWNPGCEITNTYTTNGGADCPADAAISLNVGDVITVNDAWTAGGITIPNLSGCVSDNCTAPGDLVIRVIGKTNDNGPCAHTLTITFQAEDECGNFDGSFTCTYIFEDDTDPVWGTLPPENITAPCDAIPDPATITVTDNCDADIMPMYSDIMLSGGCAGTIERTWTAADCAGNEIVFTQYVTLTDTVPPVIVCPDGDALGCNPDASEYASGMATATDNCGITLLPTVLEGTPVQVDGCNWSVTHFYAAVDDCGNPASCTQVFTFTVDLEDPTTTCPQGGDLGCNPDADDYAAGSTTWFDNCGVEDSGVNPGTPVADASGCGWSVTHTYWAVDACGNDASCNQTYTWTVDLEDPTADACPLGSDLGCNPEEDEYAPGSTTWSDNCGVDDSGVTAGTPVADATGCGWSVTHTYWATDDCGNLGECTQVFTWIIDLIDPVLTGVPANTSVQCFGDLPAPADVMVTDNCDDDIIIDYSQQILLPEDGPETEEITCDVANAVGINPNVWTLLLNNLPGGLTSNWIAHPDGVVFDQNADGTARMSGKVVAADDPTLVFLLDINLINKRTWAEWSILPAPPSALNRTYKDATGLAAAGGDLWTTWDFYEIDENNSFLIGFDGLGGSLLSLAQAPESYRFGWQVGDAANDINAAYGMSSWLYYEGDLFINGVGYSHITGNGDVNAEINCGPNFNNDCNYDIVRRWTAEDDCGNLVTAEQIIHIQDTTDPVLSDCPADATAECDDLPDVPVITALDNCSGATTVSFFEGAFAGNCSGTYTLVRTWTAIDDCNNVTTCSQEIEVSDNTAPEVLSELPDVVVACGDELPTDVPVFFDACDAGFTVTPSESIIPGDGCEQVITRTWTAEDDCGNTSTSDQVITVITSTTTAFQLDMKVFLQGPTNPITGLMTDNLRSLPSFPLVEPFTIMGFNHTGNGGGEHIDPAVLTTFGENAIVDWILVEVRDVNDATIVLQSKSALIQRDGDIVDVDGISSLTINGVDASTMFISVRHRNHLCARTAQVINIESLVTIDFSAPDFDVLGGTYAMTYVGGIKALVSADASFDGQVNAVDKNSHWRLENSSNVYYDYFMNHADFNLDGVTNAVDKNAQWRPNNNKVEFVD